MGPFQTVAEGPPGPAPGAPIAARDANQPGMETAPASGAPGPGQPASAAAATTSTGPGEPAKKKKGFWSRIFGRDGKEKPAKPDPP
jgi:hypothetical protein